MASVTFSPSVGGDGSTVSDDANPTTGLANGGHRTRFVPSLAQTVAVAANTVTKASEALASANNAAASAATALSAPGTSATSVTSLAVSAGSKSLTLAQTGKSFAVGQFVQIVNSSAPTNWMIGAITAFNSGTGAMTVSVTHTGGTGTYATWTVAPSSPPELPSQSGNAGKFLLTDGSATAWGLVPVTKSTRTSNVALTANDGHSLIEITSGTFTQTFNAASSLGTGWWCYITNSGTGDITLDPNGAELIDGLTSYVMYPGETRLVHCNGTALTTTVLAPFVKDFSSTDTFTKPPGYKTFLANAWGGGGGGGAGRRGATSTTRCGGAGGGGGGFSQRIIASDDITSTVTVTIGAFGTGGVAQTTNDTDGAAGSAGGTTTFGSYLSAGGGNGGNGGNATTGTGPAGGFGGASVGANSAGEKGFAQGTATSPGGSIAGFIGGYGGGGGGGTNTGNNPQGAGGISFFGSGGGGAGGCLNGSNLARQPGNGGFTAMGGTAAAGSPNTDAFTNAASTVAGTTGGAGGFACGGGGGGPGGGGGAVGGAGGAGGFGGGGGGGGASLNGFASGAGGNGGSGFCRIFGM